MKEMAYNDLKKIINVYYPFNDFSKFMLTLSRNKKKYL